MSDVKYPKTLEALRALDGIAQFVGEIPADDPFHLDGYDVLAKDAEGRQIVRYDTALRERRPWPNGITPEIVDLMATYQDESGLDVLSRLPESDTGIPLERAEATDE